MIYLIGSLRNPEIPKIASKMREHRLEVFDDWYAAGPEADDYWRDYEKAKGHSFQQALQGAAARNVFQFDKRNIERANEVVLVCPAGKSGHLELGWALGQGKTGYILLEDPDRWDVMYQFADMVTFELGDIIKDLCQRYTINTIKTPQKKRYTLDDLQGGEIRIQSENANSAEPRTLGVGLLSLLKKT